MTLLHWNLSLVLFLLARLTLSTPTQEKSANTLSSHFFEIKSEELDHNDALTETLKKVWDLKSLGTLSPGGHFHINLYGTCRYIIFQHKFLNWV